MSLSTIEIRGLVEASMLDWPGKLSTVVFLPGCNLRCPYCHARDILSRQKDAESIPIETTLEFLSQMDGWIDGVVISGGEPTLHPQLPLLAAEIKSRGFAVKLDTNGTRPHVVESLISERLIDAVAVDIKAPLDYRYLELTRTIFELDDLRRTISLVMESSLEYEFRTTVSPAIHSPSDIAEIAQAIQGADRYALQPFNPHVCLDPKMQSLPRCPVSMLEDCARLARGFVKELVIRK